MCPLQSFCESGIASYVPATPTLLAEYSVLVEKLLQVSPLSESAAATGATMFSHRRMGSIAFALFLCFTGSFAMPVRNKGKDLKNVKYF